MPRQVDPKIINLDNNRIDVVFEINEGPTTKVRAINFIGNSAFSDSQLRFIITTTQTNLLSFLKSTNIYDPDRLNLDRELLRQFYMKNGYADARIISATADLDRDGRGFFITFTIEEGERYRFGTIDIESNLTSLNVDAIDGNILTRTGRVYNADKVEKTVEALTIAVSQQGYAFGQVKPRFDRDEVNHVMNITYVIDEGPRIYIERINIVGNFRTHDDVIRREFRVAEGDAFNRLLVEAARKRLRALGFFKSVDIDTEPGSAPDRVVLGRETCRAANRRALLRRRLFDQRRRDRRYQPHRAQSDGQRPVCPAWLLGQSSSAPRSISASPSRISSTAISRPASISSTRRSISPAWPPSRSATPAAISGSASPSPTTPSLVCVTSSSARRFTTFTDDASLAVQTAEGTVERLQHRLHRRL